MKFRVYLNNLDPKMIQVELYADGIMGGTSTRQEMHYDSQVASQPGNYIYSATVPASRRKTDYTARIIPCYTGAIVPLEVNNILWQR